METQVSTWENNTNGLQNMALSLQRKGYKTSFKEKVVGTQGEINYALFRELTEQECLEVEKGILILNKDFLSFPEDDKKSHPLNEEVRQLKQKISDCARDIQLLGGKLIRRRLEKEELEQELTMKLETMPV